MNLRSLFLGSAMALALAGGAYAQDSVCVTPSQIDQAATENGYTEITFDTKEQIDMIRALIADATGSDKDAIVQFDLAKVFDQEGVDTSYLIVFKDGCVVKQGEIPKEVFAKLKIIHDGV
jgi:hypothetical protein